MSDKLDFWDWMLLLALLVGGMWPRLSHLERVGVRTVDEGSYCFFAISLLNGDKHCIQDKPGQALILASSFALLGISQYSAVAASALLGIVSIQAFYWLGLLMKGKRAAVALAASAAFQPYLLYYNRSAASDSNFLCLCVLGLCFFFLAVGQENLEKNRPRLRWLGVSGILFGFAAAVNLASIPPYTVTAAFLGLLCWQRKLALSIVGKAIGVFVGGGIAGLGLIEIPLSPFIDFPKVWAQFTGHAAHILVSQLRWEWAKHLWMYVGPLELFLAAIGLFCAKGWWRTPKALFPLLAFALILFYARAKLSLPRLHLPLLMAILPLMALGADRVLDWTEKRFARTPRQIGHLILALVILSVHYPQARRITSLRSGYPEACHWLSERMAATDKGVATHTWWTFMAFTGRTFSFGSDRLAKALVIQSDKKWEDALYTQLSEFQQQGYRFLVLDYLLFNRLDTSGVNHWRQLTQEYPPEEGGGITIANPIAGDYETWAEDGLLPPLGDEPLGQFIYIYSIETLMNALAPW